MNKLRMACLVFLFLIPMAHAKDRPLAKGWGLNEWSLPVGKDTAAICSNWGITVLAPGEEISCGVLGTGYVVYLIGRQIYYKDADQGGRATDYSVRDAMADSLAHSLTDENYSRLETLRSELIKRGEEKIAVAEAEKSHKEYLRAYEAAQSLALIREFETRYASKDPDGLISKLATLKSQLEHQEYLDSRAHIDTADKLADFIAKYQNNDPDGLIPKLANLKLQLHQEYLDSYAHADTEGELADFAVKYENYDPDSLVQKAQDRRHQIRRQRQAEQDRIDRAEQKRNELDNIASRIVWCNHQTSSAYQAIDREREIAQVSGYENKLLMRQAGEIIVSCRNSVRRDYDAYRSKGGSKSLAELK